MTQPGGGAAEPRTTPDRSTAEQPWPVRVVSQKIQAWVGRLGWVWVDGQVAQITRRPGATVVFITLRDPAADLSLAVTARPDVLDAGAPGLTEGARIVVHAKPEFFPGRGTLSLRADEVRRVGLGELLARLERLRRALAAEGLFDPARKRRLPFLPNKIGLITGRASAAERDVRNNATRRWPAVAFRVINVAVQGPTAVSSILDALADLDRDPAVDVIIIARGGGSIEDLLPFSDEALCRAVYACHTPVISAIGHESDAPLLDFVADVRASTPTDAARRAVPDFAEEVRGLNQTRDRLRRAVRHRLDREQQALDALRSRPVLAAPGSTLAARTEQIRSLVDRARRALSHRLERAESELHHTLARLRSLSPAATLERGYAIALRDRDGVVLRDPAQVRAGDELRLRLARGELHARVNA